MHGALKAQICLGKLRFGRLPVPHALSQLPSPVTSTPSHPPDDLPHCPRSKPNCSQVDPSSGKAAWGAWAYLPLLWPEGELPAGQTAPELWETPDLPSMAAVLCRWHLPTSPPPRQSDSLGNYWLDWLPQFWIGLSIYKALVVSVTVLNLGIIYKVLENLGQWSFSLSQWWSKGSHSLPFVVSRNIIQGSVSGVETRVGGRPVPLWCRNPMGVKR